MADDPDLAITEAEYRQVLLRRIPREIVEESGVPRTQRRIEQLASWDGTAQLYGPRGRGECAHIVGYQDAVPRTMLFVGFSYD